jgi:hypothetical protein
MDRAAVALLFVTCLLASTSSASAFLPDSLCLFGLHEADGNDVAVSATSQPAIVEPLVGLLPPPRAASHRWPEETAPRLTSGVATASIRAPPSGPPPSTA